MKFYFIEKNIPVSPCVNTDARWKQMAAEMEIYDSRVVKTDVEAERLCNALKRMMRHGTMRRIDKGPTYRVWRIG